MCGIAGIAYFNKSKKVRREELVGMSEKIKHRGPDDNGIFISDNKNVGFINRRLAIMDLSKNGHMPMTFQNRYVITYNGEFYDFKQQKLRLEKFGNKFSSNSDTEVILALYSKHGVKCLKYLRGMFAFAIYDKFNNTIFIARDRIGKKPLKYYYDDEKFIFASELKSILTLPYINKEVDIKAINKYLLYGYIPSPLTGFKNINKLEPGNYLVINCNQKSISKRRYWQPKFKNKLELSENEWCNKILESLEESTKLRMISDVPIGSFLSGGVDSSAITALMALNSKSKINTFSILFKNKKYTEKRYADLIVKKYKTNHHELVAKPESVLLLPEIAKSYEEPFSDNSALVSSMVCKMARKYVTVALNGDGGDELFAGYPNRYLRLKRDIDWNTWITKIRPLSALKIKRLSNFLDKSKLPIYNRFASYNTLFTPDQILNINKPYSEVKKTFDMFKGLDMKDAGLKFDQLYFLPDQLLVKMDIASMSNSLETRSPLLDHKFIELTGKIPFKLKVKNGETKYIFKKALEKIVPMENLYREKMGFTIPLEDWFKDDLKKYSSNILNNKNSLYLNFVKPNNNFTNQQKWALTMLELWYASYF